MITKLYKDQSATLWKGPLYCGDRVFFATLDLTQEKLALDSSWVEVDWSLGISLRELNNFLREVQLDINATTIERAHHVAVQAHFGQTRWNGDAYVTHPMRIAAVFQASSVSEYTEDEQVVAYLHDVVEDTDITPEQLRRLGFSEVQIAAIDSVTKREGESYLGFVLRAKENYVGRQVKIADIEDNLRDLNKRRHKSLREKYLLALWVLRHYD